MIRTQLSLDAREYELVKKEAATRGISIAEFVRQAVRDKLPAKSAAPWMRYAGFVESGDPHSSQSIDELVYGSEELSGGRHLGVYRVPGSFRQLSSSLSAAVLRSAPVRHLIARCGRGARLVPPKI